MPSKLKKAIGAVKDQTSISLAKVASSNNSSNLEVAVLKATTHDDVPMDERYVHEILQLVSSNKEYAAACARAIGKRIGRTRNWIVAIKSLMLLLRIFQDGDPYFPREVLHAMKRGAKILNLSSFRDDSNSSPWDYTAFIRTFALYLDERLDCFLTGKLQRRYTHHHERERNPFHRRRGKEPVHDMKPAMLLDKISYWQRLLERAVATRPTGSAKANRLVQISFYAVVQESFDLYKDISDGLALLLDNFFHMQYNSCVNVFQACVKATKQFEELSAFYDLCKSIGVGRTSEYPSVQKISQDLIETLQEFLKDQSSFPATGRSPNKPLLPSSGRSSWRLQDSYGQSDFSETTERASDFGSRTSLGDLISATELTGACPSISIDLEAYSIVGQLEKQSRDDAFCTNDDAGSTQSLPIMTSMVDLVSLEEWPQQVQGLEKAREEEEDEQEQKPLEPSSTTGLELVVVETATPTHPFTNGLDHPFLSLEQEQKKPSEYGSREGWELVLAETMPAGFNVFSSVENWYQQSSVPPNQYNYNPFLQDTNELTAIVAVTAPAPTFQAIPTFCAQNPNSTSMGLQNENDPFASYPIGSGDQQGFNQQKLLHEQQLWVQQQNKIIARHIYSLIP